MNKDDNRFSSFLILLFINVKYTIYEYIVVWLLTIYYHNLIRVEFILFLKTKDESHDGFPFYYYSSSISHFILFILMSFPFCPVFYFSFWFCFGLKLFYEYDDKWLEIVCGNAIRYLWFILCRLKIHMILLLFFIRYIILRRISFVLVYHGCWKLLLSKFL